LMARKIDRLTDRTIKEGVLRRRQRATCRCPQPAASRGSSGSSVTARPTTWGSAASPACRSQKPARRPRKRPSQKETPQRPRNGSQTHARPTFEECADQLIEPRRPAGRTPSTSRAAKSEKEAGGLVVPRLTFIRPPVPSSAQGRRLAARAQMGRLPVSDHQARQRCEAPNVVRGSKVEGRSLPPSRSLPKEIRRDAIPKQLER
jgi:hypothetical protein